MKYKFNTEQHLHTLDDRPLTGTSSIGKILGNPGLVWWASGKACEKLGWTNGKIKVDGKYQNVPPEKRIPVAEEMHDKICSMNVSEYLELLDTAYKAHRTTLQEAAEAGTDLHAELEDYVKAMMKLKPIRKYDEKIQPFIDWADENVKKFLWSEAHCFDEELWVGGISDAGAELNDGKIAVIDFKSAKDAYPSHFLQTGGYSIQINKNGLWDEGGVKNKKLEKPVDTLLVVPFGAKVVEPVPRYDVEAYQQGFRNAVSLYRLLGFEGAN